MADVFRPRDPLAHRLALNSRPSADIAGGRRWANDKYGGAANDLLFDFRLPHRRVREAILGGEPDRFRRLEIDTKLELGREFHGQLVHLDSA